MYKFCSGPSATGLKYSYEQDKNVFVYTCQRPMPWHLKDIAKNETVYSAANPIRPATIYIVDTYVDIEHPEFEGRASVGYTIALGEHYHGTHVAAIAAGKRYGVCKSCYIRAVQVLDGNGMGTYSHILKGLAWVSRQRVGIVNFSIGGPKSEVVNNALFELYKAGYTVIVAAGNDNQDSCNYTPGSALGVIAVGAYNIVRQFSKFSNYGKCVDISAPGENIQSAIPHGQYAYLSGTSMASPVVAGLAGVYLSQYNQPQSPAQVRKWLLRSATTGKIQRVPPKTANRSPKQTLEDPRCATIKETNDTVLFLLQKNY